MDVLEKHPSIQFAEMFWKNPPTPPPPHTHTHAHYPTPPETDLVLSGVLHDLFVDDFVHDLEAFDGPFLGDADILLLQGDGSERVVEVEQALGSRR